MLDLFSFLIISYQIVVFILPGKRPWADAVNFSLSSWLQLLFHIPFQIAKGDRCVFLYGMMDPVNIVINAFVFRFYPSRYINLSLKLFSLIGSCQLFDL